MAENIKLGQQGEELAAAYLATKKFEIIHRNYRHGRGEIDIIARRGDWTIFVEVKTRTSTTYGEPEAFVTPAKARQLYQAAEEYIFATAWQGHVRFDVVSVKVAGNEVVIDHFEDAIN